MDSVFTVGDADFRNLSKNVLDKYKKAIPEAAAKTLSVTAFRGRKAQQAAMPKQLDRPAKPIQGNGATRVLQAKAKDGIDGMSAIIYLSDWANEILRPNILGETIYELYGQPDILVPNIGAFDRPAVKRALGKVINKNTGNVSSLRYGKKLDDILAKKDLVFEIKQRSHPWLERGIYFRNKQRNGKGKGLFTLFTFQESANRKASFDFFGAGESVYASNIAKEWPVQYREQLKKLK